MLPPQLDTDQMAAIGPRAFRYFDPLATLRRKVNVYWALFAAFPGSWALQAVLVTLSALVTLGSPVGTNKLLAYIEDRGEGAVIRPWVWILLIALSPFAMKLLTELYMYYNGRTATQIEAIITAVVYRHALRIRVVNNTDDSVLPTPPVTPSLPKATLGAESETATNHSRAESSSAESSTATTAVGSDDGNSKKNESTEGGEGKKSTDVVGKLNNLVTSDLESITAGRDVLLYGMNSITQLVLGSWFLYTIMGWSAFVGLGVMVVSLFPFSHQKAGYLTRLLHFSDPYTRPGRRVRRDEQYTTDQDAGDGPACRIHQGDPLDPAHGQAVWLGNSCQAGDRRQARGRAPVHVPA
jgi:hypothetical protein